MATDEIKTAEQIKHNYRCIDKQSCNYDQNIAIISAMHEYAKQAVDVALQAAADTIKKGYDFDGEWKSEQNPEGIVNRKVSQSILQLKQSIYDKLKLK